MIKPIQILNVWIYLWVGFTVLLIGFTLGIVVNFYVSSYDEFNEGSMNFHETTFSNFNDTRMICLGKNLSGRVEFHSFGKEIREGREWLGYSMSCLEVDDKRWVNK